MPTQTLGQLTFSIANKQVEFGDIHEQNLEQLRKLNLGIFPVRYNAKFYTNILNTPNDFTQVTLNMPHQHSQ